MPNILEIIALLIRTITVFKIRYNRFSESFKEI